MKIDLMKDDFEFKVKSINEKIFELESKFDKVDKFERELSNLSKK